MSMRITKYTRWTLNPLLNYITVSTITGHSSPQKRQARVNNNIGSETRRWSILLPSQQLSDNY